MSSSKNFVLMKSRSRPAFTSTSAPAPTSAFNQLVAVGARYSAPVNDVRDPAVWLLEQHRQEVCVCTGCDSSNLCEHLFLEVLNLIDLCNGAERSFANPLEHEQDPVLPVCVSRDPQEKSVVLVGPFNDVAGQVEDRLADQSGSDQHEDIHDATGSAVSIFKWMDSLELIVRDSHHHQGINPP